MMEIKIILISRMWILNRKFNIKIIKKIVCFFRKTNNTQYCVGQGLSLVVYTTTTTNEEESQYERQLSGYKDPKRYFQTSSRSHRMQQTGHASLVIYTLYVVQRRHAVHEVMQPVWGDNVLYADSIGSYRWFNSKSCYSL